jgi:colanic acid/amylovoran biosynthesis glycosyltransferase
MQLAYLLSCFPMLSETFVIREMMEMERLGHSVQPYSLKNHPDTGYDEVAEPMVRRTQYSPFLLSAALVWANVKTAFSRPVKFWGTLLFILVRSMGQPKECLKGLAAFPKTIYYGTLMAGRGVDHLHVHFANVPTLSALVIHRIWGIPYSFTSHAHDLFVFRTMLAEKLHEASFAVTISEFNRKFLERHCAAEDMAKVRIIHCGADVERLAHIARRPEPGLIVSVARLSPMKGFIHLVEACALLRERGLAVRCEIGGEGPERPVLEERIRAMGLEETVKLRGAIRAAEVAAFIARGEIFALPCVTMPDGLMDGVPVSLMEAMALGLPAVSTTVSGIPELVRDGRTGLAVPPRDVRALADALGRLLSDRGLADRLAAAGQELVRQEFDLHLNARRVAELVGSLRAS